MWTTRTPAGGVIHVHPTISSVSCSSTATLDEQPQQATVDASTETIYNKCRSKSYDNKTETIFGNVRLNASRVLPGNETLIRPRREILNEPESYQLITAEAPKLPCNNKNSSTTCTSTQHSHFDYSSLSSRISANLRLIAYFVSYVGISAGLPSRSW